MELSFPSACCLSGANIPHKLLKFRETKVCEQVFFFFSAYSQTCFNFSVAFWVSSPPPLSLKSRQSCCFFSAHLVLVQMTHWNEKSGKRSTDWDLLHSQRLVLWLQWTMFRHGKAFCSKWSVRHSTSNTWCQLNWKIVHISKLLHLFCFQSTGCSSSAEEQN